MATLSMRVVEEFRREGCSAGLDERTAVVEIAVDGTHGPGCFDRIRAGVARLYPEQPLYGVGDSDWPRAFLTDDVTDDAELLGGWVVALTVAVQRWARDPVWRGRVIAAGPAGMRLAIPWHREELFTGALQLALRLIEQWSVAEPDQRELQRLVQQFRNGVEAGQNDGLAPNTLRFIQGALRRGIPFAVRPACVQLGWGADAERMDSSFTGRTGVIASMMVRNKGKANATLRDAGIPVPQGRVVRGFEQAEKVAAELGWPVVVKPLNQDQGVGVVPNIKDTGAFRSAFEAAARLSPGGVIVEKHVAGDDHRLLVVHGRVLAAARRIAGGVVGDGVHNVEQLVGQVNADPLRGDSMRSLLRRLKFDGEALDCLADQGVPIESVPASGRWIPLRRTANVSTGGSAVDVTEIVHPDNAALAVRAAEIAGLDIAGIDLLSTDISRSWREIGGAICEVNAQPGFRPHWLADPARDVNGEIVEIMFGGRSGRIPTAAITGTNGKSTTAEMLSRIWTAAGRCTGVCTTTHLRIGDETVSTENLSGYPGARVILEDPAVQAAVLEMPRKGLIMYGHPCDRYDVAALLNVQDDHIGVSGIDTLEQMAELKAEVLQRATGAVVVNADDPLCMAMLARAGTDRHILVTGNPVSVADHRSGGGEAVFAAEHDGLPWIMLCTGDAQTPLMPVHEIPATMNGLLKFNESNAMFAAALAWAQGIDPGAIRRALAGFHNSAAENPGRYNFFDGLPFQVMLDYGHNPDGVRELCRVAAATPVQGRRILCTISFGNRHTGHFGLLAREIGDSFDSVVIGCNADWISKYGTYAGDDPVAAALAAKRQALLDNGFPADRVSTEPVLERAIRAALASARPGDLVVVQAEPHEAIPVIHDLLGEGVAR